MFNYAEHPANNFLLSLITATKPFHQQFILPPTHSLSEMNDTFENRLVSEDVQLQLLHSQSAKMLHKCLFTENATIWSITHLIYLRVVKNVIK